MYTSKVYNFLLDNVVDKKVFPKFDTKILFYRNLIQSLKVKKF